MYSIKAYTCCFIPFIQTSSSEIHLLSTKATDWSGQMSTSQKERAANKPPAISLLPWPTKKGVLSFDLILTTPTSGLAHEFKVSPKLSLISLKTTQGSSLSPSPLLPVSLFFIQLHRGREITDENTFSYFLPFQKRLTAILHPCSRLHLEMDISLCNGSTLSQLWLFAFPSSSSNLKSSFCQFKYCTQEPK